MVTNMNLREWALPFYTILIQLATGAMLALWLLRHFAARKYGIQRLYRVFDHTFLIIFLTVLVGMLGAHFHLSKPYLSFLAVLNLRWSWLSREIFCNMLFFGTMSGLLYLQFAAQNRWRLMSTLGWLSILFGLATIYCMARIYLLPTQTVWNTPMTVISFISTALLLGVVALVSLLIMDLKYSELRGLARAATQEQVIQGALSWFLVTAIAMSLVVLIGHVYQFFIVNNRSVPTARTSLLLLVRLYPALFGIRLAVVLIGLAVLAVAVYWQARKQQAISNLLVPTYVTCLLTMIGEILGRFLFYATHVRVGI
jgi:anaerobic dimethyl sulfoxide reductase subunit C (anchor subunit)